MAELMYRILITIDKPHLDKLNDLVKHLDSNKSEVIRIAIDDKWTAEQVNNSKPQAVTQ